MSDPEIALALAPVLAVFRALDVRHCIGGSVASSAYGLVRASIDVDVVADLQAEHALPLVAQLSEGYYISEARVRDAIQRRASFNLIHFDTMFKIDVFVAKNRPFDRRTLDRAGIRRCVLLGGLEVPMVSAEDAVLAKLEWYRRGGEVSEKQWGDILGVLRVARDTLDCGYLQEGAVELGVGDLLKRALDEAEQGPHPMAE
ncbi:MAG: hypothetical protein MUF51_03530 [Vicinamibacteria bacterium]|jgi:hypothetical protein|nr:hypothetical protein [Vicinamibacteria bacterium]